MRDTASNWTLGSNATLTAGSFIGRYEFNGTTTLNINEGAVMNITGTLQAARDGKSVMNIARDAMVLAQTLNLGQNWDGSEKGVTINLNGGSLMLGAGWHCGHGQCKYDQSEHEFRNAGYDRGGRLVRRPRT